MSYCCRIFSNLHGLMNEWIDGGMNIAWSHPAIWPHLFKLCTWNTFPSITSLRNCPSFEVSLKVFFYIPWYVTWLSIRVTMISEGENILKSFWRYQMRTSKKTWGFSAFYKHTYESCDQILLRKVELHEIYKCQWKIFFSNSFVPFLGYF